MIPTGRAVGAVETIKWLTRCSLISSAARLSGSAGPINVAPKPASSPAVACKLTARRRARQLYVRHDPPARPGRCIRFNPRRLHHNRMHVIARHQLGYRHASWYQPGS